MTIEVKGQVESAGENRQKHDAITLRKDRPSYTEKTVRQRMGDAHWIVDETILTIILVNIKIHRT
ncbi:hypothetical protein [Pseudomonas sp. L13]|uniref:hypothetical protein n=1 Tax=Pseudomonas sp. L13 TaxID=343985 RepID=UPI0013797FB6|nr:hypothetical protein [Pseudomonas sp. L13]